MLYIGKLKLHSNLILAPMAGISDLPFRMLNRRFGCELAFVEMINARSVSHNSKKTKQMLSTERLDKPLGVQLLGCELKYIEKALEVLNGYKFDILDFNAACPAKKVIRRGEGAGLLKEPGLLHKILRFIVKGSKVPVTVKMRTGWDELSVNALDVAMAAEDAGVAAIFIHGRTKIQGYSGSVDYQTIRKVKKSVNIPVIASGDVLSHNLARRMFDETRCDGILIARGSLGNPWIFKQVADFLKNGHEPAFPSLDEITSVMQEHLQSCVDFYGEKNGVIIYRKFFSWYTKGFRGIRPLREESNRIASQGAMVNLIKMCLSLHRG